VSVNPYQKLGLYDRTYMEAHIGKGFSDQNLPPHIFSLADEAFNNMRSSRLQVGNTGNQVIVIRLVGRLFLRGRSGASLFRSHKLLFEFLYS